MRCALRGTRRLLSIFFVPVMRSKSKLAVVPVFGFALLLASTALAQTAAPWPEADHLFHSDPRWLGGDPAFSVGKAASTRPWTCSIPPSVIFRAKRTIAMPPPGAPPPEATSKPPAIP